MTDAAAALSPVPTASDLAVYRGLFQSMTGYDGTAATDGQVPLQVIKNLQKKVAQFHLSYKFAIDELTTKIEILQEEFEHTHDYSPIEHVRTRLKSMDSIIEKVQRTGISPDVDSVRARIRDIAGVRITCAFVADAYWVADTANGFRVKPSAGLQTNKVQTWTAAQYCAELQRPADRFQAMTGQGMARLFRAPGGKTSPALLAAAKACGWTHVGWSPAGFLGDELSSDRFPNATLLARALRDVRSGDILLAHLGIWSRQDPWAPAVLEPLIQGLKAKGHCFATLAAHPVYRAAAVAR